MRLDILDGIRGHLLIMMMLAHLSWQPDMGFLGAVHHARLIGLFDAEFLVFMSGLLVGMLMVRKFKSSQNLNRFLIQRLDKVYRYYLISALPFLALTILAAPDAFAMAKDGVWAVGQVLALQNGGGYSDILPIYICCFALLLAASLTVMRFGTLALLSASLLIYAVSLPNFAYGFFGFGSAFMAFDLAAWQFLFFIAYALGTQYENIVNRLSSLSSPAFFALLGTTTVLLVWQRGGLAYPVPFAIPVDIPDNWARMHLHPLHLLRILIVCAVFSILMIRKHALTSYATRAIEWYFGLRLLRFTGIYSIQMFVFHVYLMAVFQFLDQDLTQYGKTVLALSLLGSFLGMPFVLRFWDKAMQRPCPKPKLAGSMTSAEPETGRTVGN
ncbi:MAG: OpgC domain-containing protein [Pelagimonas sp.]|uniref:OpgC domain-containing protein n=1 Tax=Pelagimonas sp. TaxID=2073170 RepID=UPI003D6A5076